MPRPKCHSRHLRIRAVILSEAKDHGLIARTRKSMSSASFANPPHL